MLVTDADSRYATYVNDFDRIYLHRMGKGFHAPDRRYGFMESPDIPAMLDQCKHLGERFDMMETTFLPVARNHRAVDDPAHDPVAGQVVLLLSKTRPAPAISSRFRPTGWSNWVRSGDLITLAGRPACAGSQFFIVEFLSFVVNH